MATYVPKELIFDASAVTAVSISAAKYGPGGVGEYTLAMERRDEEPMSLIRTFHDFASVAKEISGISGVPELPPPPAYPWFVKPKLFLGIEPRDFDALEIHRVKLDDWAKSVMVTKEAREHAAWNNFLSPSMRPDWPAMVGPVDLSIHDLQHKSAVTEWWYWNMHFTDAKGRDFSAYFCVFAKEKYVHALTGDRVWGFAVHAALIDVSNSKYYQRSILDIDAPDIVRGLIDKDPTWQPMLKRAYGELLAKNELPLPDELNDREVIPDLSKLEFTLLDCHVEKLDDGTYSMSMRDAKGTSGYDVKIKPTKKVVRHGFNGVTKGHGGDHMFYYFVPRCSLEGTVFVDGEEPVKIAKGQAWYDHEFGGQRSKVEEEASAELLPYAWSWCAVQLDNDYEISMCNLWDMTNPDAPPDAFGKLVHPDDTVEAIEGVCKFEVADKSPLFQSKRSFQQFPLEHTIKSEELGIDLKLTAAFADQEILSIINQPGYWEGRILVTGTFKGKPVTGFAFIERAGFQPLNSLNKFFKNVGKSVREEVRKVYPDEFDERSALNVVARKGFEYYMDGVSYEALQETLVKPVRSIIDRGGKSWRSFASLACVDVVGGDSRELSELLAMPEFLHVGSLIIDDIQDESDIRRGGTTCHKEYGMAIAINAGSACYFQFETVLTALAEKFDAETRVRAYDEYFLCLRAGHAGQALDIYGLDYLMDDAIARGDAITAERRVLATHRLKTAAPAGTLSRIGAILGGGTDEQIRAIGEYFEGVGTAFQIMDDVLNLRGLITTEADKLKDVTLKTIGEDITAGKVTIPVVKAIGLLPQDEMRKLWDTIKAKPSEPEVVLECIEVLEKCGAIDACVEQAIDMVESSWAALDPLLKPSFSKIMLRSFGWFVTERNV